MIVKLSVDGPIEVESLVSALEKVVEGVAEKTTKRLCVSAEVYVPAAVSGGEGGPSPSEGGGETSISGRRQAEKKEVSIQTVVNAPAADLEEIQYSVTTSAIQVIALSSPILDLEPLLYRVTPSQRKSLGIQPGM
jgi:hypothetical protein